MRLLLIATALLCLVSEHVFADWPAFLGGQQRDKLDVAIPSEWSPQSGIAWRAKLPGHGQSSPVQVGDLVYVTAIDGPQKETNLVLAFDLATGKQQWEQQSKSSLLVKNDVYTSRAAPTPVADKQGVYAFFESGNLIALSPSGEVRWERSLIDDYGKYQGRFGLGGSLAQLQDRIFVLADNEGPAYLLAIDKASGETLWKTERTPRTAWSSPMIVNVDGKPQIVVSSAGSIDGYDPATGKQLWTFDDVGGNTVASPIPFGDGRFLVGASPGRNGENTAGAKRSNMAIEIRRDGDAFTPVVLWRNEQATSSFGTPIVHQGFAYYTNRAGVLFCLDAKTGETSYNARIAESNWATPIGLSDRIYFFGRGGTTTVMAAGGQPQKLAENKLYQPAAGGGGRGGFGGEIQYGVALTPAGIVVRTGSMLYLIGAAQQD
jgi:outer membrane protein assembly factor BamB